MISKIKTKIKNWKIIHLFLGVFKLFYLIKKRILQKIFIFVFLTIVYIWY